MYQNYSGSYGGGGGGGGGSGGSLYGAQNNYYSPPATSTSPSHGSSSQRGSAHSSGAMSHTCESAALALLQHLGKDDLQHLLDNDSKLQDLINDLPQVKNMQAEHDNQVMTNKSLADYNLSLQPRLEHLKQHVATEYEQVNTLKTDLAENKTKLDSFVGRQSLDTLLALLQTEVAKSEEKSEEMAEQFFNKETDMDEFLSSYLPQRTLYHLRRLKSEKFAELIRERNCSAAGHPPSTVGSQDRLPYPNGGIPPYPTSGFGMPQPSMYIHQ